MPQQDDNGVRERLLPYGSGAAYSPELTPERLRVLAEMADDYLAGRRVLCLLARAFMALGMLAGAAAGLVSLIRALHGVHTGLPPATGPRL